MDNTSVLLLFFIGIFGISSWIDVNGIWVETPLLVNRLPEGWKLPTFMVALVQLANISPLIYMCVYHYGKFRNMERYTIYLILFIGCFGCLLLTIFWNHTILINFLGEQRNVSVSFFILIWILSTLDTTSSVTFLPYFVNYPRQYITALYVGEGLSGFIPGISGLIQGIGGESFCINKTISINGTNQTNGILVNPSPRFSISEFFAFVSALLVLCLISFSLIDNLKYFRKYKISNCSEKYEELSSGAFHENDVFNDVPETDVLLEKSTQKKSSLQNIVYVLVVAYINFFTNGVLPSIQNYSLMPYSSKLYHLVVTMSQILNPLACLVTLRSWKLNNKVLFIMTTLGSIGIIYIIFLASKSPVAILNDTVLGQILAASSWFFVIVLFCFLKALLAIELQKQGHVWLQYCGAATQIGSAVGALLIFILVAIVDIFKSKPMNC